MRLDQLLDAAADARGDAVAFHWVDRERRLTYAEATDATDRAAAALAGLGVGAGDHVGIFAHPGLDYVIALFATWRLGATAATIDLTQGEHLAAGLGPGGASVVVYTNDHVDDVRRARPDLPDVAAFVGMDGPQEGTLGWDDILGRADPALLAPLGPTDAMALVTGSGADGPGPGVGAAELLGGAHRAASDLGLVADDRLLCPTPLAERFHIEHSVLAAVGRGASAAMFKSWEAGTGWDAMEEHGITVLCAAPRHCVDVLHVSEERGRPPGHLRIAVVEPREPVGELVARFRHELDVELLVA